MEIYKQIRKMRLNGMSQRQIAATLHISRNTVKKYWDGDSVPWERKDYSRDASVLTEDVVAFVRQCLDEDSQCRSKKQHHTAKRIYDRLVAEYGFTGGETTVRRLVKELREKSQEAFVYIFLSYFQSAQLKLIVVFQNKFPKFVVFRFYAKCDLADREPSCLNALKYANPELRKPLFKQNSLLLPSEKADGQPCAKKHNNDHHSQRNQRVSRADTQEGVFH